MTTATVPTLLFRTLLVSGLVGSLSAVVSLPRPARACTCIEPLSYILPLWGSREVPRNTRIFVYRHRSGSTWFHPAWEFIGFGLIVPDDQFPETLGLVSEAQVKIPLDVERADVRPEGPSTWWLAPRVPLEPNTRYQVRLIIPQGEWTLTEFTTTAEHDSTPPNMFLGVQSVNLSYFPGYQPNRHGDCGGQNALEVRFAYYGRAPLFVDSPLNAVMRLFLRREDSAYDFDSPLVDVPLVATKGPDSDAYYIGWTSLCTAGLRIELDECTKWCVRAHPMDLAGNIQEIEGEGCEVLSSLVPFGPDGPGERKVCPGEGAHDPGLHCEALGNDSQRSGTCHAGTRGKTPLTPLGLIVLLVAVRIIVTRGIRRVPSDPTRVS